MLPSLVQKINFMLTKPTLNLIYAESGILTARQVFFNLQSYKVILGLSDFTHHYFRSLG